MAGGAAPHDQLKAIFSGDALQSLESLGVAAFDSSEVEQTIIARLERRDAPTLPPSHVAQPQPVDGEGASLPARPRIPRKAPGGPATAASPLPAMRAPALSRLDARDKSAQRATDMLGGRRQAFRGQVEQQFLGRALPAEDAKFEESERERLILTGEITPFEQSSASRGFTRVRRGAAAPSSSSSSAPPLPPPPPPPPPSAPREEGELPELEDEAPEARAERERNQREAEAEEAASEVEAEAAFEPEEDEDEGEGEEAPETSGGGRLRRLARAVHSDDSEDASFLARVREALEARLMQRRARGAEETGEGGQQQQQQQEEEDVVFDGGLRVPGRIWDRLFAYQKTSIKWMWELHCQRTGGIVADEMGLGKTVQLIAFLAALHYTEALRLQAEAGAGAGAGASYEERVLADRRVRRLPEFGPVIVLCPATIMAQWLEMFRDWYPEMRVMLLHQTGAHECSNEELVERAVTRGDVLITTYETLRLYQQLLLHREWHYAVLDEGHKIRNPDAEVTLVCKRLLTVHRIVMTGSPIQNNLIELWSLFDFVFPGKLGTLPVFEAEFCAPIIRGGYSNASRAAAQLAYKCAVVLRDLINPYILRRSKASVASHLPGKSEQVLFCNLTPEQRLAYQNFLESKEARLVLDNRGSLLSAISVLRKICNHPDLLHLQRVEGAGEGARRRRPPDMPDYGAVERSGKLKVVQQVLRAWHAQGHRVLLFAQTRQMLDILEDFVAAEGYEFRRLDGETSVARRIPIIAEFNRDSRIFAMLLTTRAGGIGVNLTGADRIILFDPDWNPSTDSQAKERAYRIGQSRAVTVYRLITRGTIEEKVYQRQIYKQFLTDKILKNPLQKRFFNPRDLHDLLALAPEHKATETEEIFKEVEPAVEAAADAEGDDASAHGQSRPRKRSRAAAAAGDGESAGSGAVKGEAQEAAGTARKRRRERREEEPAVELNDDESILALLLSGDGGVHSALSHDRIVDASEPSAAAVEARATQMAERAVAALRRCRDAMVGRPIDQPTWTGRSGSVGAPAQRRFGTVTLLNALGKAPPASASPTPGRAAQLAPQGAPRHFDHTVSGFADAAASGAPRPSSELLERLRLRNAFAGSAVTTSSPSPAAPAAAAADDGVGEHPLGAAERALLLELHALLRRHPAGVASDAVVAHFAHRLRSDEDKFLLRQLLRRIAHLERQGRSPRWVLRAEFE